MSGVRTTADSDWAETIRRTGPPETLKELRSLVMSQDNALGDHFMDYVFWAVCDSTEDRGKRFVLMAISLVALPQIFENVVIAFVDSKRQKLYGEEGFVRSEEGFVNAARRLLSDEPSVATDTAESAKVARLEAEIERLKRENIDLRSDLADLSSRASTKTVPASVPFERAVDTTVGAVNKATTWLAAVVKGAVVASQKR